MNTKIGLDYFSFDVDFFQDEKIQFVSARFGTKGEAIAIRLLCKIYRQGYYIDWNNDTALLFAKGVGDNCLHSCVNDVVCELLKRGFFDKSIFERFSVLTSRGIQKRYFTASGRRTRIKVRAELLLADISEFPNISVENQNVNILSENVNILSENVNILSENVNILAQSKVKESKVKESKGDSSGSDEPPDKLPPSEQKPGNPRKPPLREREPENNYERVEKAYLQNWDLLYSQKRVETPEPIVNWNQARKLLKQHFVKLRPERIIHALNNGLRDDWIMAGGYSLGTMLSASVLNGLINSSGPAQQKHRIAADSVSQENVSSYFREAK